MAQGQSTEIILMMKRIRTSRLSMKKSLSGEEFFIDNLLVRIHFIVEMLWWTGLAPWEH